MDNQEANQGPEWYHRESSSSSLSKPTPEAAAQALVPTLASDAAAARADGRATLGAPRIGGQATLEAPTDLFGLAGLLQAQAKAHDNSMKRMEASIASLVSAQAKHSQALARIEALVGKVRKRARARVFVCVCVCVCVCLCCNKLYIHAQAYTSALYI